MFIGQPPKPLSLLCVFFCGTFFVVNGLCCRFCCVVSIPELVMNCTAACVITTMCGTGHVLFNNYTYIFFHGSRPSCTGHMRFLLPLHWLTLSCSFFFSKSSLLEKDWYRGDRVCVSVPRKRFFRTFWNHRHQTWHSDCLRHGNASRGELCWPWYSFKVTKVSIMKANDKCSIISETFEAWMPSSFL